MMCLHDKNKTRRRLQDKVITHFSYDA